MLYIYSPCIIFYYLDSVRPQPKTQNSLFEIYVEDGNLKPKRYLPTVNEEICEDTFKVKNSGKKHSKYLFYLV